LARAAQALLGLRLVALPHKIPVSTLIVVHTPDLRVLLIERADAPGYWQSVTGSQEPGETLAATATRELREETGIDAARYGGVRDWQMSNVYEIYPRWRYRYAPGITHNTEHVFGLEVPEPVAVVLEPREHRAYTWLAYADAATKCFSWSNRDAILRLPEKAAQRI
jgi:dihydroneopterin triphosphate diphosphatase